MPRRKKGFGWNHKKKKRYSKSQLLKVLHPPDPVHITPDPVPIIPDPVPITPDPVPIIPDPVPITSDPSLSSPSFLHSTNHDKQHIAKTAKVAKTNAKIKNPSLNRKEVPPQSLILLVIPLKSCNIVHIVQGNFHQGCTHMFPKSNRTKQSIVANAISACAASFIKDINKWTRRDINAILLAGDELYHRSVELDQNENTYLNVKVFDHQIFLVGHDDFIYTGQLVSEIDPLNSLKNSLEEFFGSQKVNLAAVLTANNLNVAIGKHKDVLFYFDPHGLNNLGYPDESGCATLLRYTNLDTLFNRLISNISKPKIEGETSIDLNKYMLKPLEIYSKFVIPTCP